MEDLGIRNGDKYLGTRHYPDRKQASLVFEEGNKAVVIGTVKNEEIWQSALEGILKMKAEEVTK